MVVGYGADVVGSSNGHGSTPLLVAQGLFTAVLCAIVVTFLILMRAGYRWARTVLTGGAIATVVYVGIRLFTVTWPPMYAVLAASPESPDRCLSPGECSCCTAATRTTTSPGERQKRYVASGPGPWNTSPTPTL